MTFRISSTVLALAVRLIDRLAVDPGPFGASTLEVRIDVVDVNHQARIRDIDRPGRVETRAHAVQPDRGVPGTYFTVDRRAIRRSMDTSRGEPERPHEKDIDRKQLRASAADRARYQPRRDFP
jgi:hypothetical protein